MIKFRTALFHETSEIRSLWNICFGDSFSYIDFYLQNGYNPENTFVCEKDGSIAAMITMLPAQFSKPDNFSVSGGYLYAVATHPNSRGLGIMKDLENFVCRQARKRGYQFLSLVPASASLFQLYGSIGYRLFSRLNHFDYLIDPICKEELICCTDSTCSTSIFHPLSKSEFLKMRSEWIHKKEKCLDLSDTFRSYSYDEMIFCNCKFIEIVTEDKSGYLVYYVKDTQLYVREASIDFSLFQKIICSLFYYTNTSIIHAAAGSDWKRASLPVPYSMIKPLSPSFPSFSAEDTYCALMLD